MKRAAVVALKLAVVGAVLWILFRLAIPSMKLEYLEEKLGALRTGWPWLAAGQVFLVGLLLTTFYRWRLLLVAQGIRYTLREACTIGFIGYFFSQFLIGSTGGDFMKAYYVAVDHRERRAAGITTVFIDRAIGLLDLVILAGAAILLNWSRIVANAWLRGLALLVAAMLAGTIAGCAIFYSEKIRSSPTVRSLLSRLPLKNVLWKIQSAVYVYKFHPRMVIAAMLLSLCVQLSVVVMAICFARAFDLRVDILTFFFIVPLAGLAAAMPIGSPGGLGQLEGAYAALFACFGFSGQDGLVLAIVQRLGQYAWGLFGGICYLQRHSRVQEARRLAEEGEREDLGPGPEEPAPVGARGEGRG